MIRAIEGQGCEFVRHGGKHDWYRNPTTGVSQPVPRHREIKDRLARHIIKMLSTRRPLSPAASRVKSRRLPPAAEWVETRLDLVYAENATMPTKLSEDQRHALRNHHGGALPVEDEQTQDRYVLVEWSLDELAMQSLQRRQENLTAIQAGISEMEAGNVVSFDEVDARIRAKLGLPQRS